MKKLISIFLLASLSTTILANSFNGLLEPNITTFSTTSPVPSLDDGAGSIGLIGVGIGAAIGISVAPEQKEPIINPVEHTKNSNPHNRQKHENGQARQKRDQGKEKKEINGRYKKERPNKKNRG